MALACFLFQLQLFLLAAGFFLAAGGDKFCLQRGWLRVFTTRPQDLLFSFLKFCRANQVTWVALVILPA